MCLSESEYIKKHGDKIEKERQRQLFALQEWEKEQERDKTNKQDEEEEQNETSTNKKKTKQERIHADIEKGKQVYHWIKVHENFFDSMKMRKLRRLENGEVLTIIYLKTVLYSLKQNGYIIYEGVENTLIEEIAFTICEDLELVEQAIEFMTVNKLASVSSDKEAMYLHEFDSMTGSDNGYERVKRARAIAYNKELGL